MLITHQCKQCQKIDEPLLLLSSGSKLKKMCKHCRTLNGVLSDLPDLQTVKAAIYEASGKDLNNVNVTKELIDFQSDLTEMWQFLEYWNLYLVLMEKDMPQRQTV